MYMLGACSSLITDHVLFFVRPLLQQMKELQRSIIKEDTDKRKYHVLFAPRSDLICEKALKDCGLFDLFESIRSFPAFVFPLDSDVLSLEMDHVFRSLHVNQDTSPLYDVASALVHIQQLYGSIPTVYGLGKTKN